MHTLNQGKLDWTSTYEISTQHTLEYYQYYPWVKIQPIQELCWQGLSSADHCQDTVPCTTNVADAFMHAIRDELRSDEQGTCSQGTTLDPDHHDGQGQAK
ncbi:hypothetical protein PCANC_26360 [Puccinia coronata f. sp. avenae]|uniref:Uncharacterized protein n=1 Tax=Puccinia coronata f. sp. avenae TaxID=200324 RepID=A0A2N5TQ27_9BASI|nr:hypothetical protein PCANC_26360 [Puccinia coronata f. sp. avenae]